MRTYQAAVLFCDILGIGALTTSRAMEIEPRDFAAIHAKTGDAGNNQLFCANLLSKFRANLRSVQTDGLRVSQQSDCAFVWSETPDLVVEAAAKLFRLNTESGVFARGGLTYGEIIEPEHLNSSLGHFVCGEAATRAAQLEGTGKGSRIFIDRKIGGQQFTRIHPAAFEGLPDHRDYSVVDEFLWFSCPRIHETRILEIKRLQYILRLIASFRTAPKFRWNSSSSYGRIHLGATIERLSTEANRMCDSLAFDKPTAITQTSEIYQELYNDSQYDGVRHQSMERAITWWLNDCDSA